MECDVQGCTWTVMVQETKLAGCNEEGKGSRYRVTLGKGLQGKPPAVQCSTASKYGQCPTLVVNIMGRLPVQQARSGICQS
jgi:hypothetical protein